MTRNVIKNCRDSRNRAVVYARERIWYDAPAELTDQIDLHPEDDSSRERRADLLEQAKLQWAESFDRASESGKRSSRVEK